MIHSKKILLFGIFFFVVVFSIAQQIENTNTRDRYRAVHWGLDEGLSQGEANSMIKDVNGLLWIGTQFGLNHFDGSSFKKYYADPASKSATKHKSMGLRITANRIAMMQHSNGEESPVTINDLVEPDGTAAGTEVIIKLPVIYD